MIIVTNTVKKTRTKGEIIAMKKIVLTGSHVNIIAVGTILFLI
jgi:hypothetical protein